jgi:hypothetical protein
MDNYLNSTLLAVGVTLMNIGLVTLYYVVKRYQREAYRKVNHLN